MGWIPWSGSTKTKFWKPANNDHYIDSTRSSLAPFGVRLVMEWVTRRVPSTPSYLEPNTPPRFQSRDETEPQSLPIIILFLPMSSTPLSPSTQTQMRNRIERKRKTDVSHHYCHDPYKGLVTLSDHPRWLEVGPPIHNPWRLRLKFFAAPVNLLLRTDAHNTLHRQPLGGSS